MSIELIELIEDGLDRYGVNKNGRLEYDNDGNYVYFDEVLKIVNKHEPEKILDGKNAVISRLKTNNVRNAKEIRDTWHQMQGCGSQMEAYRILERMVERLGYGRDTPSLVTLEGGEGTSPSTIDQQELF